MSHLFISSNGILFEEETTENLLGVIYQFQLEFYSDGPENHIS